MLLTLTKAMQKNIMLSSSHHHAQATTMRRVGHQSCHLYIRFVMHCERASCKHLSTSNYTVTVIQVHFSKDV